MLEGRMLHPVQLQPADEDHDGKNMVQQSGRRLPYHQSTRLAEGSHSSCILYNALEVQDTSIRDPESLPQPKFTFSVV